MIQCPESSRVIVHPNQANRAQYASFEVLRRCALPTHATNMRIKIVAVLPIVTLDRGAEIGSAWLVYNWHLRSSPHPTLPPTPSCHSIPFLCGIVIPSTIMAGYLQLDRWKVSRLTIISSLSVLRSKYIVARFYRTDPSQFVDLRLEPLQQKIPRFLEAVSAALSALPTSTEYRYTTSLDFDWSSPTPPSSPSEYPLTITFSLAPNSPVGVSYDTKEEILYEMSTIDEGSLTLLTIVHIASIPSTRYQGDFAEDFADRLRSHEYHWMHASEDDELSNINHELQQLSELRLQLAAELRSCLYNAENTAMEVQAFNAWQCERLDVDGPRVLIDFQDDLKVKQDVGYMIHRLERPAYIRGLRR
jgi:hypothetical protein